MKKKQVEIIIELFKDKDVKEAFLKKQYIPRNTIGSIITKKLNEKIEIMLTNWIKNEDSINKKWLARPEISLSKLLMISGITPPFSINYNMDIVSWLIGLKKISYEDILFFNINGEDKLVSSLTKKELVNYRCADYRERLAVDNALSKIDKI